MSLGQRVPVVAPPAPASHTPAPVTPIASVESDWDDDVVDYQNDRTDDTVNVAGEALDAAAAGTQGMSGRQAPKAESAPRVGPATNGGTRQPPSPLPVMIRVAASGAVVTNKGGSEELAGVVAYAHRLIELVGDMLGLEGFIAVECAFKGSGQAGEGGGRAAGQERCLLFAEQNGDTVLVRPRAEGDLRALRETLGL